MLECRLFVSMFKLIWIQKLQFCFDHNFLPLDFQVKIEQIRKKLKKIRSKSKKCSKFCALSHDIISPKVDWSFNVTSMVLSKFRSYYTIGGHPREKFFENVFWKWPLYGVKTCEESEFDILKQKHFPESRKHVFKKCSKFCALSHDIISPNSRLVL
jgi:hypothetical protein